MMRLVRSSVEMPGVVVEAQRRRGRLARRIPNNNYIAERRSSRRNSLGKSIPTAAPKSRRCRKAGAPVGNRNALKCGLYTARMKARRARFRGIKAQLRSARMLAELVLALNQVQARTLDI